MAGKIRGFMHLDNGQESIPALVGNSIRKTDLKHTYYRDHTHAIASGRGGIEIKCSTDVEFSSSSSAHLYEHSP